MEIFRAIASPIAPVVCRLDESQPRRGGIQANDPEDATMRHPYRDYARLAKDFLVQSVGISAYRV